MTTDLSPSNNHQGRKLRATIDHVPLDIYLPYESQLGGKLRLKVEVLAEYPDELSFEKWTLLKLEGVDPAVAAEVLDRASTVSIEDLPTMIGQAFDLIGNIIKLSKTDQKLLAAAKKSWLQELELQALRPQTDRPRL